MDINKVTLLGYVVRKPEAKQTSSGRPMGTFTVATTRGWNDPQSQELKEKADFHRVVAWGKLADIAVAYLNKGSRLYLEGRICYGEWTDAEGKKRMSCDIVATEVILLGLPKESSGALAEQALLKEEGASPARPV